MVFTHFWVLALAGYIVQLFFPDHLASPFDYRVWVKSPGTVQWLSSFNLGAEFGRCLW